MHLLVLSAFRREREPPRLQLIQRLNAPFGAQCFPTLGSRVEGEAVLGVSMHLLVLSAFRLFWDNVYNAFVAHVSMHLLVLSAFRLKRKIEAWLTAGLNAPFGAQCFPTVCGAGVGDGTGEGLNAPFGAQCFPTPVGGGGGVACQCLNAPFGAQCFPTSWKRYWQTQILSVSMHLLVLSAFRLHGHSRADDQDGGSQCTFWCSVLSDGKGSSIYLYGIRGSQCTFWCSVLSDLKRSRSRLEGRSVSMHLLVLSAFRPDAAARMLICGSLNAPFGAQCFPTPGTSSTFGGAASLNAPFGAQCFPTLRWGDRPRRLGLSQCTFWCSVLSDTFALSIPRARGVSRLNAPFGAQCFPTDSACRSTSRISVSMHLLVLSAFRLYSRVYAYHESTGLNAPFGAQCFPTR